MIFIQSKGLIASDCSSPAGLKVAENGYDHQAVPEASPEFSNLSGILYTLDCQSSGGSAQASQNPINKSARALRPTYLVTQALKVRSDGWLIVKAERPLPPDLI